MLAATLDGEPPPNHPPDPHPPDQTGIYQTKNGKKTLAALTENNKTLPVLKLP